MDNDLEAIRQEFLNYEFEVKAFDVVAEDLVSFAKACGEQLPRYTDTADPDFQATPTWASSLARGRNLPETFPMFGGVALDGGKDIEPLAPIRPGMTLTGRSHVHDIYSKTGRSGRMIFVISRMALTDADGTPVANADTRLVIRENAKKDS